MMLGLQSRDSLASCVQYLISRTSEDCHRKDEPLSGILFPVVALFYSPGMAPSRPFTLSIEFLITSPMPHFPAEAFGLETGGLLAQSKASASERELQENRGGKRVEQGRDLVRK